MGNTTILEEPIRTRFIGKYDEAEPKRGNMTTMKPPLQILMSPREDSQHTEFVRPNSKRRMSSSDNVLAFNKRSGKKPDTVQTSPLTTSACIKFLYKDDP